MLLQLKCQNLQITVPGVDNMLGLVEVYLRETFFRAKFGGEEVDADFRNNPTQYH